MIVHLHFPNSALKEKKVNPSFKTRSNVYFEDVNKDINKTAGDHFYHLTFFFNKMSHFFAIMFTN